MMRFYVLIVKKIKGNIKKCFLCFQPPKCWNYITKMGISETNPPIINTPLYSSFINAATGYFFNFWRYFLNVEYYITF